MEDKVKPIKRHKAIQGFSREHHFGLLVSWKIRQGLKKGVDLKRIKRFADWSFKIYIKPHFDGEEKFMFPLLDDDDKLKKRAIAEHRRLERLFKDKTDINRALNLIEEELDAHIRFEERNLFNRIQEVANEEQLRQIEEFHKEIKETEEWKDKFWE